jgi:hypothetical protein
MKTNKGEPYLPATEVLCVLLPEDIVREIIRYAFPNKLIPLKWNHILCSHFYHVSKSLISIENKIKTLKRETNVKNIVVNNYYNPYLIIDVNVSYLNQPFSRTVLRVHTH